MTDGMFRKGPRNHMSPALFLPRLPLSTIFHPCQNLPFSPIEKDRFNDVKRRKLVFPRFSQSTTVVVPYVGREWRDLHLACVRLSLPASHMKSCRRTGERKINNWLGAQYFAPVL